MASHIAFQVDSNVENDQIFVELSVVPYDEHTFNTLEISAHWLAEHELIRQ